MTKPLSDAVQSLKPSGIRKFFDIVSEMKDAISLGVGEPDLTHHGIFAMRVFMRWKKEKHFTPQMPD